MQKGVVPSVSLAGLGSLGKLEPVMLPEAEQNPLLSFTISLCGLAAALLVWGRTTGIRLGARQAWHHAQTPARLHEGGIRAGVRQAPDW
ncbi:R-spondin-2 [Lates japonicus]|uniref:R-spondin-2 n=1 Tax=Lates japonicus TaxID=270547 RepID=A0AAD3M6Y2_LATJO|nr:R-spondin-2 [Lates japonicus]